MPTAVPPVRCHAVGRDRRAKRTWQPPSVFSTSELRRPRRELQPRGRFTLSPGLGAGTPLLTYACAFRCRPLSAHETQPTGRKPGSGLHAIASTTTPVRASGRISAANDVDDSVSGDITQGGGLPLTRTEPPRVPGSPVHLMRSPHRARRAPAGDRGPIEGWEENSKNLRRLLQKNRCPAARRGGPDRIRSSPGLLVPPCEIVGPGAGPRRASRAELSPCLRPPRGSARTWPPCAASPCGVAAAPEPLARTSPASPRNGRPTPGDLR